MVFREAHNLKTVGSNPTFAHFFANIIRVINYSNFRNSIFLSNENYRYSKQTIGKTKYFWFW